MNEIIIHNNKLDLDLNFKKRKHRESFWTAAEVPLSKALEPGMLGELI